MFYWVCILGLQVVEAFTGWLRRGRGFLDLSLVAVWSGPGLSLAASWSLPGFDLVAYPLASANIRFVERECR